MLTLRIKKHPQKVKAIISEILDYDDMYSSENKMFKVKKPTLAQNYIAEYRIITNEKEPRIFEVLQSAVNEGGKLKYRLSITVNGKQGTLKDLEKLSGE